MANKISKSLEELLVCFPILNPPIIVSADVAAAFSAKNPPIPGDLLYLFFNQWDNLDEYTEMVPCFRLESFGNFYTLVYWKGSLLSYEYKLITISKEGKLISKKVIAGTLSNNHTIVQSVATIDEDLCIYTMVGESELGTKNYKPENSAAFRFEILPDGIIASTQEEKNTWEKQSTERKN
jgi:hypothetical protein